MKTLFLSLVVLIGVSFNVQAQEIMAKNAIGIRLSPGDATGIEASYQRQMISEHNRIELNLGLKTGYVSDFVSVFDVKGYYHWVFNIVDKLNWYAGPGVGVQFVTYDSEYYDNLTTPLIGAEGGVEYRFDFPLQVSLSIRPSYYFYGDNNNYNGPTYGWGYAYDGGFNDDFNLTVGIGARYTF